MAQMKRKDFAHWINTAPSGDANYELEGVGVEALSIQYNPQIDTFKSILDDVASNVFQNYQMQSSISGKRIDKTDAMWTCLNEIRKSSSILETDMIEMDMSTLKDGKYDALKYSILIVLNEFLGENATISYDIYVSGTPVVGTAVITDKKPVFTATV